MDDSTTYDVTIQVTVPGYLSTLDLATELDGRLQLPPEWTAAIGTVRELQ